MVATCVPKGKCRLISHTTNIHSVLDVDCVSTTIWNMQQPKVDVLESVLDFCYRQPFLQDYRHISQEGATYKRRHANFLEYEVHFSMIVWFHGLGFTPTLKISILQKNDALSVTWQLITCCVTPKKSCALCNTSNHDAATHTDNSSSHIKCTLLPGPEFSEAASRHDSAAHVSCVSHTCVFCIIAGPPLKYSGHTGCLAADTVRLDYLSCDQSVTQRNMHVIHMTCQHSRFISQCVSVQLA